MQSVPKTLQENGVAERMSMTIVERVGCMLSQSTLPKSFFREAVQTSCYLINRPPSSSLDGEVLEKVWTEKNVRYNYLRIFGCMAFLHVPKDERAKLDDKARQCIFLEFDDE